MDELSVRDHVAELLELGEEVTGPMVAAAALAWRVVRESGPALPVDGDGKIGELIRLGERRDAR